MTRLNEASARQRAKEVLARESSSQELSDFAEYVLATTGEPTMADVEWSDEEHYLAGAIDAEGVEVVMLYAYGDAISVCDVDDVNEKFETVLENPVNLTPNGKKYRVCEVTNDQPEHPVLLVTKEDYENAPDGTIVASDVEREAPYMKQNGRWWRVGLSRSNEHMSYSSRVMLREGWA